MQWLEKLKGREIPEAPGVYIFRDRNGTPLYVGKAKNLKNRLRAYMREPDDPRIRQFVKKATDVEFIVTPTENDALLLEANLIKEYQPRYNIRLKDNKAYPYIMVTMREKYPRVAVVRRPKFESGNLYFGPYPNVASLRKTLRLVRRIFPIRSCKYKLPSSRQIKPCLEYHIGKCIGPCTGEVSEEEYRSLVRGVIAFLRGQTDELERELEREMLEEAQKLNFERAAVLRDQLFSIRQTKMAFRKAITARSIDFVAVASSGHYAYGMVVLYRGDRIVDKHGFMMELPTKNAEPADVLASFMEQYYTSSTVTADEIVFRPMIDDLQALQELIEKNTGRKVKFREPTAIEERIYRIATENAERLLSEELERAGAIDEAPHPAVASLQKELNLDRPPLWIEAVDISHTFGEAMVGSVVVFVNGRPKKSQYRRYRIKSVEGIDDFRAIREVVYRRLRKLIESDSDLPDLMLIDGGEIQLQFALDAANELGVEDIHFIGIAKKFEELHFPDGRVVMLPYHSDALRLLQRIRDEAHRFAITYHRKIRGRDRMISVLDMIPGLSESRRIALLRYFGSIEAIHKASVKDLQKVKGIGPKLARRIYSYLHGEE